jgi:hypothetical protein
MPLLRERVLRNTAATETNSTLMRHLPMFHVGKRDLGHPHPFRERIQGP